MGWLDAPSPMGALKRVGRMGHALYQVGESTLVGPSWDIVRSPFVDDPKLDGFWNVLIGRPLARGGDAMSEIMGPKGVLGEAVGAAPAPVRGGANFVLKPVNNITNNLYRNVVSEPITTLITMGSMMSNSYNQQNQSFMGRLDTLTSEQTWKDAYKIAQHRSPGQAEALALSNTDIFNQAELAHFQGTDAYRWGSGAIDAAMRWELDPQVLAMKGVHMYRASGFSLHAPVDVTQRAMQTDEDMANWANSQVKEAQRWTGHAQALQQAGLVDQAKLAQLHADRTMQQVATAIPDFANRFYSDTMGIDRWRADGLTNEVTPWNARTQESFDKMMAETKNKPSQARRAQWARDSMNDLNERLTRTEYEKKVVGVDQFGANIYENIQTSGQQIGLTPFDPSLFPKAGLQAMTPEGLLKTADFGAGLKYTVNADHIAFEAVPRGYVPKGYEPENLAHVAHNPSLVGRDLVDKPWTSANGVIPDLLLGSVGSRDAQLASEGVGAPAAKVLDHTIAHKAPVVAFTVGTESDPSILRATKQINSHPDIHTPTVPLMRESQADTFLKNSRVILTGAADIRDSLASMPKDFRGFVAALEAKLAPIHAGAADAALKESLSDPIQKAFYGMDRTTSAPVGGTLDEMVSHVGDQGEWKGTLAQKRKLAEDALMRLQKNMGGPTININMNKLLTPEMIQTHPVTAGQLANSEARITAPMAWDRANGKYVPQESRFDLHGDIRVKDPGLIPNERPKVPLSAAEGGRDIVGQPGIDKVMNGTMSRFGFTQTSPWGKIVADAAGKLWNPDPLALGGETLPRDVITHSKLEEEVAHAPSDWDEFDFVSPWEVPDTMYHTTAFADQVEATGKLEARLGGGFGSDPYNLSHPGVSFTSSEAAAKVNASWYRDVVAPLVADLGAKPTTEEIYKWMVDHAADMGIDRQKIVDAFAPFEKTGIRDGHSYEPALNILAATWRDAHNLAITPELFVLTPDEAISRIKAENVKTYKFDGNDLVNAPGDFRNPMQDSEYRYYGDVPLVKGSSVSQGGYASWSQNIEQGQEAQAALTERDTHLAEYKKTGDIMARRAATEAEMRGMRLETESMRVQWAYDHTAPGEVTMAQREKFAGYARDRYWPHEAEGARYATALAFANDTNEMNLAFRTFLGDFRAYNEISVENIILKKTLEQQMAEGAIIRGKLRTADEMNVVNALGESMTDYYSGQLDDIYRMVDQTALRLQVKQQILDGFATMKSLPVPTARNALRSAVTNSELYQLSPWTKPVRMFFRSQPHRILNTFDPESDIQWQRELNKAGVHPDEVQRLRGQYMAMPQEDRYGFVTKIDQELVTKRLKEAGLEPNEVQDLIQIASRGKSKAASIVSRTQYDALPSNTLVSEASNHLGMRYNVIEDANEYVVAPLWPVTQTTDAVMLTNFDLLDKALGPVTKWKQRYSGLRMALDVPAQLMDNVQKVWRNAVLFRPAWPIRIISEAQLRMMSKVGVMATLAGAWDGFKDLTDYSFRHWGMKVDDIVSDTDRFADSPVHQMAGLPDETATAQFLARVNQVGEDVDQLAYLENKVTEARNDFRQRQIREQNSRQLYEESQNPNTMRLFQDAHTRFKAAEKNMAYWEKQAAETRKAYFKAPSGESRAAFDKANFAWDDSKTIYEERKSQAAEAARAAQSGRDQTAYANWQLHKSEMDEAAKAVKIVEGQHATYLQRTSARMRLAFADRPGAEQMAADTEQAAQGIVNPPPPEPGPAGPTHSATRAGMVGGAAVGGVVGGPAGAAVGAGMGATLMRAMARLEADGMDQFGVNSYRVQGAFGTAGDKSAVLQQAVSQQGHVYEFLSKAERKAMDGMEFNPHQWRSVPWNDPAYGSAWSKAVRTIQQDPMGQMILKLGKESLTDEGFQQIHDWLMSTTEGRSMLAKLPQRRGYEAEWIEQLTDQASRYTGGFDQKVLDQLAKGEARPAMLDHINPQSRPTVHGPELDSTLGRGPTGAFARTFEKAMFALGTAPVDHLSRFPYFNAVYEAEITRMLEPFPAGRISEAQLRTMEEAARNHALNEVNLHLHDLAERSEFADMAKFFMPFFGAWQQVMTRWAGIAIDNPLFAVRALQVWGAPNKIPGLMVHDPTTGEQYIQFRLPEAAKALIGHGPLGSALDSQGYVRFTKGSMSMLASGTPGFGPFVNLAVSQIVKEKPEVYDAVKSLLPFGVSDSVLDPFLPSAGRRLVSLAKGQDDAAFASTYHQVFITRVTNILDHKDPKWGPDDLNKPEVQEALFKEVSAETHKLYSIRLVAAMVSPVPLEFNSIYKPMIDDYRSMRELNPETADQLFMQKYGDDMVYLTQAVTKTNNGVPPTLHGAEAEEKFGSLIAQYPEYGSVIVGPDAGGESAKFMAQVYNKQLTTPVTPGSDVMQRERLSDLEQLQDPQIRLGWQEFSRYMDKIDAYMIQNGFKTYAQAPNMRDFKNQVVSALATKYPAWGDEYFVRDERKWQKRIDAFTAMTQEPGLQDRPDMQGVAQYLKYRSMVMQVLKARDIAGGSGDLFAQSNSDVYDLWATARMTLKEQNLQFADLYNRYLDRDPLTTDPILGTSE